MMQRLARRFRRVTTLREPALRAVSQFQRRISICFGSSRNLASHPLDSVWALFVDYDNDGWKDLFVGQGHVMDNIQLYTAANPRRYTAERRCF